MHDAVASLGTNAWDTCTHANGCNVSEQWSRTRRRTCMYWDVGVSTKFKACYELARVGEIFL